MKDAVGTIAIVVQLQRCSTFGAQATLAVGALRIAFDIYDSTIDRVNDDGATD
jgi:hypothetical protein